jgi:deferrochelatase/peroxidase EfeB
LERRNAGFDVTGCPHFSRRGFLGAAGGALAASTLVGKAPAARADSVPAAPAAESEATLAFYGRHQAGIATPKQVHMVFASFDVVTEKRAALIAMLQDWTKMAARLAAGETAEPPLPDQSKPPSDNGDVLGLSPQRLSLTFGFGPGLFEKDGKPRFGLKGKRPAALVDLPRFNGDQLDPKRSGGDICIQACADDGAVAFHAIRQLARIAAPNDAAKGYGGKLPGQTAAYDAKPGVAELRWIQTGFLPDYPPGETPRNLLGFKDGTQNPGSPHPAEIVDGKTVGSGSFDGVVWVGKEGPDWMQDGSYLVVRRVRLFLEHWDRSELDFQEQVIGRKKASGAPLTADSEFAPLDLAAQDKDGNPITPLNAHVALGAASSNNGARIFRRSYSYNDGLSLVAERWPPWRQGLEYDAGLIFIAFQRDPCTGFIQIFERMSKLDLLGQYSTHVGSAVFACPGGVAEGGYIGQTLFQAA